MENMINVFNTIKNQKDALDHEYEALRLQIIELMKANNLDKVDIGFTTLVKEDKNYITYDNEGIEMIKKLQPEAVTELVDNKAVKNALKNGDLNTADIDPYREIKVSKAVLIKNI